MLSKKGAETWDAFRTKGAEVKWWKLVRFSFAVPRDGFIL